MKAIFRPQLLLAIFSASQTFASTPDAWQQFEDELKTQCSILFDREFSRYQIHVDPYGSDSYGIAFAKGKLRSSSGLRAPQSSMICIYNKQSHKAEVGQSFDSDRLNN
ncbi:hypothetical protein MD588_00170 [Photobacterium sp. SDRW27]|uniref:hypothetical protein n=1 Tax=Photobacterium obscurum TaxID=2829490 RepID=UPI0022438ECE|nr:hypothetical protein [Photobacterium obscurum]MCW8327214.1 hypothetical protein [Photobacterium obscurum]